MRANPWGPVGPYGFLNWSLDGNYLYFDTVATHTTMCRLKPGQRHSEMLVDLTGLARFGLAFQPEGHLRGRPVRVTDYNPEEPVHATVVKT